MVLCCEISMKMYEPGPAKANMYCLKKTSWYGTSCIVWPYTGLCVWIIKSRLTPVHIRHDGAGWCMGEALICQCHGRRKHMLWTFCPAFEYHPPALKWVGMAKACCESTPRHWWSVSWPNLCQVIMTWLHLSDVSFCDIMAEIWSIGPCAHWSFTLSDMPLRQLGDCDRVSVWCIFCLSIHEVRQFTVFPSVEMNSWSVKQNLVCSYMRSGTVAWGIWILVQALEQLVDVSTSCDQWYFRDTSKETLIYWGSASVSCILRYFKVIFELLMVYFCQLYFWDISKQALSYQGNASVTCVSKIFQSDVWSIEEVLPVGFVPEIFWSELWAFKELLLSALFQRYFKAWLWTIKGILRTAVIQRYLEVSFDLSKGDFWQVYFQCTSNWALQYQGDACDRGVSAILWGELWAMDAMLLTVGHLRYFRESLELSTNASARCNAEVPWNYCF